MIDLRTACKCVGGRDSGLRVPRAVDSIRDPAGECFVREKNGPREVQLLAEIYLMQQTVVWYVHVVHICFVVCWQTVDS